MLSCPSPEQMSCCYRQVKCQKLTLQKLEIILLFLCPLWLLFQVGISASKHFQCKY